MEKSVEKIVENNEENAIQMFQNLKKHCGEEVTYKAWTYGVLEENTDVLKNVNFFETVRFGKAEFPFIGYGTAISSITLCATGEELYSNPYNERDYDRRTEEDIINARKEMFGDMAAYGKVKKVLEEQNKEIRQKKYKLMKNGLAFVKEGTEESWLQYVEDNIDDIDLRLTLETVVSGLKNLHEGATCESVKQIYNITELSESYRNFGLNTTIFFSPRGDEFKRYLNEQLGMQTDGEEISSGKSR